MRPRLLKEALKALYKAGEKRAVCIEGPPGGGKTEVVKQVGAELGVPVIEMHMPTMLVEDFGILFPSSEKGSNTLDYRLPYWYPQAGDAPEEGILLFDDRNQAGGDLQKVLANICQARSLHGVKMPDGWMVVSTGNRREDAAGSNRVLTHLRNRETVMSLETHIDDWRQWALEAGVKPEIVSFISYKTDLLHKFDAKSDANPTPRSWVEGVNNMLGVVPADAEMECFAGAVGEGAAAEFVTFLKVSREMADPDEVIKKPSKKLLPESPIAMYALVGAVAHRADKQNLKNVVKLVNLLGETGNSEYGFLLMRMISMQKRELCEEKPFTEWVIAQNKNEVFF